MSVRARLITIVVAAVAGVLGATAIFFFFDPVGGALAAPVFYFIPSVITWLLLSPLIVNRSVPRATLVGLLSPVVACLLFVPFFFIGFYWAVALIKLWWLTVPIGVATSLLIQLLASDYSGAYRRLPRVAALLTLLAITAVASARPILRSLNDPLRANVETLRAGLIAKTPIGSTSTTVLHALGSAIHYQRDGDYSDATYDPEREARRHVNRVGYLPVGYPVGTGSIEVTLGTYRTLSGIVRVNATWAFDPEGRLLGVFVHKRWLHGNRGANDPP